MEAQSAIIRDRRPRYKGRQKSRRGATIPARCARSDNA